MIQILIICIRLLSLRWKSEIKQAKNSALCNNIIHCLWQNAFWIAFWIAILDSTLKRE